MLDFLVMGLAVWRLSAMFSYECGPFKIFMRMRRIIGFDHADDCEPVSFPDNFLSSLFGCVWCLSVWFAIIIVIGDSLWPGETLIVCRILALSAVTVIIERIARG